MHNKIRFCAKTVTMARSGKNAINNGCSYIFVNFEHFDGAWMNMKIMKSKGNKSSFENAYSKHKNQNFKKEDLDPRGNTSLKTWFTEIQKRICMTTCWKTLDMMKYDLGHSFKHLLEY